MTNIKYFKKLLFFCQLLIIVLKTVFKYREREIRIESLFPKTTYNNTKKGIIIGKEI